MEAKWAKRDGIPPEEEIHKAIKDGLPEPMTEKQFNDTLTTIELNDESERAAFKVAQDEVKGAQANLRKTSEPRSGINANQRRKQSNNTNGRGIARYCTLCKNAGMPERKYMSHSDANCQDKEEMARRAMSSGMADQNKQVRKYMKESKALLKKLNKMTSKNKKILEMSKKKSSDSKEVRKLKRKFAECNSSSDDDSDDSDDASISSASDSDTD